MIPVNAKSYEHIIGANSGNGITVTLANNAKSSPWVELGQSSYDLCGFWIASVSRSAVTNVFAQLDIGISSTTGDSSPEIIVADLYNSNSGGSTSSFIPVRIPAGAYVSIRGGRVGSTLAVQALIIGLIAQPGLPAGYAKMACLNVGGTFGYPGVDIAGASAGSWVEIIASTSVDYDGIGLVPSAATDVTRAADICQVMQVGIGTAGNETAVVSSHNSSVSGMLFGGDQFQHRPTPIRAGVRIAGRAWGQAATDSSFIAVYGLNG